MAGEHPTSVTAEEESVADSQRLRIGFVLPVEGPKASRESITAFAREAERLHADSLWASDRILMPATRPSGYPYSEERSEVAFDPERPWFEPLSVLGLVAGITERVELGTHVLVLPYRQPVVLARELASLDRLSNGRVVLGVGVGWMREEFAALGVDMGKRGRISDEYIRVLRSLWSTRGPVGFDGEFVSFDGVSLPLVPSRVGGPPVLIGGNSRAALLRAARCGDGWLGVDLDPDETGRAIAVIREACAQRGRSPGRMTLSMRRKIDVAALSGGRAAGYTPGPAQLIDEIGQFISAGVGLLVFDLLNVPDMVEGLQWVLSEVVAASHLRERGRRAPIGLRGKP